MTVTVTTTETLSRGDAGYIGYVVHNPARPQDERRAIWAKIGQISIVKEKTSVVDGSFIPGKYRVNPYAVKGGTIGVPNEQLGSYHMSDFPVKNRWAYPGIDSLYFGYIDEKDPIYLVTVPFVNTYWTNFGGYIMGKTYYQVVFLFGDWWRYALPMLADQSTPARTAADFEQISLQKAYGKIRSADLPMGENLGELRETIQMLREPLSALTKFLVDDRSRNLKTLKLLIHWSENKKLGAKFLGRTGTAAADAAASTWMELRYGFRPLVAMVEDVVDRIQSKHRSVFDPDVIHSVRTCLDFGPYRQKAEPTTNSGGRAYVRSIASVEDKYQSSASVQFRLKYDGTSFLDSLGLTPRFLPEVAWELTRLSFVVDWILSIGPWLATLRVNPGVEILGNTSGFKHSRSIDILSTQLGCFGSNPDIPWTTLKGVHPFGGQVAALTRESYTRKVNLSLSYLPHFTWGRTYDIWKEIDTVALLWQNLPQLFKR